MGYFQEAPSRPPGDAMNLEELTMPHNDVQAMFISITFDATVNLCSPEMSNNNGAQSNNRDFSVMLPISLRLRMAK